VEEHEKLVCVKTFSTEEEAQIAQGFLKSSGIEAMISDEDADPARAGYVFGTGVKLLVRKEDVKKASEIFKNKK